MMTYEKLRTTISVKAKDIETRYPFRDLPCDWEGLYAPDNGVINVQLLLRTLLSLAKDYGAEAKQNTRVESINLSQDDNSTWEVHTTRHDTETIAFKTKKIVITSGAYVNHVLKPSFGISLDLDIWEMVSSYFNAKAGPNGTNFPSTYFAKLLSRAAPDFSKYRHVVPVCCGQRREVSTLLRLPDSALGPSQRHSHFRRCRYLPNQGSQRAEIECSQP